VAAGLPCSKPKMMNYSNMAMVWAEIVLHKDVDWRTVYERNVNRLNRGLWIIPTNWMGPSDCWPRWSNRMSNSNGYGALIITRPHEHPRHGLEYNLHQTVGHPLATFSVVHRGPSHGYEYTLVGNPCWNNMLKQHFKNDVVSTLYNGRCCLNKEDKSTLEVVEKTFKRGYCLNREILNHIRVLPPITLHCGCYRSCCYMWLLLALYGEHTHIIVLLLSGFSWLLKLSPR
jgi:hypothetical protein